MSKVGETGAGAGGHGLVERPGGRRPPLQPVRLGLAESAAKGNVEADT